MVFIRVHNLVITEPCPDRPCISLCRCPQEPCGSASGPAAATWATARRHGAHAAGLLLQAYSCLGVPWTDNGGCLPRALSRWRSQACVAADQRSSLCPQCSVAQAGQFRRSGGPWVGGAGWQGVVVEEAGEHETNPRGLKPTLLLFHESLSMATRSSGFRIDESGSAPAALMSSSTAVSHEKVRRAEGTCGGVRRLSLVLALTLVLTLLPLCWSQGHTRPGRLPASDGSHHNQPVPAGSRTLKPAEAVSVLGTHQDCPPVFPWEGLTTPPPPPVPLPLLPPQ